MAGTATGLTAALVAAAMAVAASGAERRDVVRDLAGAYHEPGGWAQVIPVDRRHAYVHLYFLGGVGADLISEFEAVMTVDGAALTYREPATADSPGCRLSVRRAGTLLAWSAPEDASCRDYANGHSPGIFMKGSMKLGSRRPASRTRTYPGEGRGYAMTVAGWRAARR